MEHIVTQFGAESAGGLGVLGINIQSFVFQLITFVLVLILLRKYVYQKLVDTLESRRDAVLESLDNAKLAAIELEKMNEKTAKLLNLAKSEAADIVALAHKEASQSVEDAELKAKKRANHLIETAESRLNQDVEKARVELRAEMLALVAQATETVLKTKLDSATDKKLIASALKEQQ